VGLHKLCEGEHDILEAVVSVSVEQGNVITGEIVEERLVPGAFL
jgi:hypothetical protein